MLMVVVVHATDPHDSKGPEFVIEPPHRLEFMNRAGARLDCVATGNPPPSIEWLDQENTPLSPIQKVNLMSFNVCSLYGLLFSVRSTYITSGRSDAILNQLFYVSDTTHPVQRFIVLSPLRSRGIPTRCTLGELQVHINK